MPVNNIFGRILTTDGGALLTIRDYFTFTSPNARFAKQAAKKNYKMRFWDGKIKLLNKDNTLYRGLEHELELFCASKGWEFEGITNDDEIDFPSSEDIREFSQSLNLTSEGEPIEVRDYQLQYITAALTDKRRLLLCPTSGGKSLIAYVITRWCLDKLGCKKGLLIVPTINLVSQMARDFEDYGWERDNMHLIYEGSRRENDRRLTITTWQAIQNETVFLYDFDFVIGDEAHHYKAKSLINIMENLIHADVRIGMSGTLDGITTSRLTIEGLFGRTFQVIKTTDLIEQGYSSDLEIKCVVLKHPDAVREFVATRNLSWENERAYLYQHEKRNRFIANLAMNVKGNTILYFQHSEGYGGHGKMLLDAVKTANKDGKKLVYYIDGSMNSEERERIRLECETRNDIVILASYGTTSTGANYKNIHNLIFGSAMKSPIKNLQTIGRGLRRAKNKERCNLYDIADDMTWKVGRTKVRDNYYMRHFKERLNIYTNEGFKFRVHELELS